jgi:hypothetical protein
MALHRSIDDEDSGQPEAEMTAGRNATGRRPHLAWPCRFDRAQRRDEMSFRKRRAAPSADQGAGELLSWVVGRKHARPGRSRTDTALGELLSWVAGRKRRR